MDQTIEIWRRQKRAELLATRQTVPTSQRIQAGKIIAGKLDGFCVGLRLTVVGLYWPIKGEPSLLSWGRALLQSRGVSLCLPVVVTPRAPLEYWRWTPGEPMNNGVWNIPCPVQRHVVMPDLMLAPLVGFDPANYRLGYGGGYFDRTLAAFSRRPTVVGVGYEFGALATIHPQPHDIPMDLVLTDRPDDNR
jgi:5,10-methenyltetrahydrofolate synthetase